MFCNSLSAVDRLGLGGVLKSAGVLVVVIAFLVALPMASIARNPKRLGVYQGIDDLETSGLVRFAMDSHHRCTCAADLLT